MITRNYYYAQRFIQRNDRRSYRACGKPYRLGEWVKVGEHHGEVIAVGMRAFQIRTPGDVVVAIPHDRIWSENIGNSNNGESTLMCVAHFHRVREQDTTAVRDILKDVARTSVYLNLDREVIVVMKNNEIGLHYQLKAYPFEPRDQFFFITDLTERGDAALRAAGLKSTTFPTNLAQVKPGMEVKAARTIRSLVLANTALL